MAPPVGRPARPLPWLACLVALGLGLRLYHYLSNPPVWHDEAALISNVLGKSLPGLFGRLFYSEAAPPLFMAAEQGVVLLLGDGTFALRLLPLLASLVGFAGMVLIARRLLPPVAVLWFAVLFGCSDRLLWHCCEAKPYAVDVLIAVGLLATFLGPRRADDERGPLMRQLALYAVLSPLLIFLSFPACFLLGGAALALLPAVLRSRSRGAWAAYVLFGVLLCGSFAALALGPARAQKDELMLGCWLDNFPDWGRPWKVPLRGIVRLTEALRYASEPIGNVLTLFAVVGAVQFWRAGRRRVVAFLVLPVALTAAAWLVGQYPLGAARVSVFLAPALLLLVAAGVAPAFAWLGRHFRLGAVPLAGLLLFPVAQAGYRVAVPWARLDSATPAAFVLAKRQPSEPVVGLLWEHAYYFRNLGLLYRSLRPQLTDPHTLPPTSGRGLPEDGGRRAVVTRLWLLGDRDPGAQRAYLTELPPSGAWHVTAKYDFRDSTALHVEQGADLAVAPENYHPQSVYNAPYGPCREGEAHGELASHEAGREK